MTELSHGKLNELALCLRFIRAIEKVDTLKERLLTLVDL